MAKAGMRRPSAGEPESGKKLNKRDNETPVVPEIQGKGKTGRNRKG